MKRKNYYIGNEDKYKASSKKWVLKNQAKVNAHKRAYYQANKEAFREYNKKRYLAKKEEIKAYVKEWCKNNKERVYEYQKEYMANNPDKLKGYSKTYYSKHSDIMQARNTNYRKNHPETVRLWHKRAYEKLKLSPLGRIKHSLRERVRAYIAKNKYTKSTSTVELLGCEWEEVRGHLEAQFKESMDWTNYGKWEIDHIRPLSLAKDEEDLKRLFHYTNLQPLWKIENIRKSNKVI